MSENTDADARTDSIKVGMAEHFAEFEADVTTLAGMIRDSTAARGVDWWAVEVKGYSATEWAHATGRDPTTVARNVRRARD